MKPTIKLHSIKQIKLFFVLTLFAILLVLVMFSSSWAATYYVDATNGNDNNGGLSQSTAWKTIAKVNNSNFLPGDYTLFKRGEVWRGQLTVPSSGSNGNPITFGAYGSGNKPVIDGSSFVNGWSKYSNTVYVKENVTPAHSANCGMVRVDDTTILAYNADKDALSEGEFHYLFADKKLYIRLAGDADPADHTIKVDYQHASILISGNDYIVVEDLQLEGGRNGIRVQNGSDYNIVQDCIVRYTGDDGMKLQGDFTAVTNNTFRRNDIRYVGGAERPALTSPWGIHIDSDVAGSSSNNTISDNLIRDTQHGAIYLRYADSTTISRNASYGSRKSCYSINNSDSCIITYNIMDHDGDNNWDTGFDIKNGSHNNLIYGNTLICNGNDNGLRVWETSTGTIFKNNIIVNTGVIVWIEAGSDTNTVIDYNLYPVTAGTPFKWTGTDYNFADWKTNSNQDANSPTPGTPLFVDSANNNFSLQSTSPCIDAGTDVGLTKDFAGIAVPQGERVDIGAFEYKKLSLSPPSNFRVIFP